MRRWKSIGSVVTLILLLAAIAAGWYAISSLSDSSCDPDAYSHCGQVSAPGPGGN